IDRIDLELDAEIPCEILRELVFGPERAVRTEIVGRAGVARDDAQLAVRAYLREQRRRRGRRMIAAREQRARAHHSQAAEAIDVTVACAWFLPVHDANDTRASMVSPSDATMLRLPCHGIAVTARLARARRICTVSGRGRRRAILRGSSRLRT